MNASIDEVTVRTNVLSQNEAGDFANQVMGEVQRRLHPITHDVALERLDIKMEMRSGKTREEMVDEVAQQIINKITWALH